MYAVADQKTRIGPVLTQQDGLRVREVYLRVEQRVDVYIKDKWREGGETKLPTVLLHGAGMDGAGWDVPVEGASLVDALARNGSHTFALDFRGHGRSSRAEDGKTVSVSSSVADTMAVMRHVREITGQPRVVLIGESFGTRVALEVAARVPDRVAGLALLGLIFRTVAVSLDDMLAEAAKAPAGYAFTTEEEWPELFIPTASPEVTAWHQAHFGTAYAYPVGPYFSAAEARNGPSIGRITGRVLVITGDLDPIASIADTEAFLREVGATHKRHLYQSNVGHMPYVERGSDEVQAAINELVDACTVDAAI
jgi:pimeloyl-ACP methyl ester carboxylesterase